MTIAPMSQICECYATPERCERCAKMLVYQLGGSMIGRGRRWAESVALRRPDLLDRPWPALDDRVRAIAASKVGRIGCPRVHAALAEQVYEGAVREWERRRRKRQSSGSSSQ